MFDALFGSEMMWCVVHVGIPLSIVIMLWGLWLTFFPPKPRIRRQQYVQKQQPAFEEYEDYEDVVVIGRSPRQPQRMPVYAMGTRRLSDTDELSSY